MKRNALILALMSGLSLAWTAALRADETVTYFDRKTGKEDKAVGTIQSESPAGITIKLTQGAKVVTIPAVDVTNVEYKLGEVKGFQYKVPFTAEKNGLDPKLPPKERMKFLQDAQADFDLLAKQMASNPFATRYMQFKSAMAQVHLARLDPEKRDAAIAALKAFKAEHSAGWEAVPGIKLLAQMQEEKGDIVAAKDTYKELRALPGISKDLVLESTILIANLLLRVKKYDEAEKTLEEASALMRDDDPQKPMLVVHLCEAQMKQDKLQDIDKKLQAAINSTNDANIRAVAHNTLGDFYREKKQNDEAFWQYLRVDVLYPQDREEHARALYWLSKLFESQRKDKEKAQECLERLKKDYEGTVYGAKALEK